MSCPATGTAEIQRTEDGKLSWTRADPLIHVSSDLLDQATEAAYAFLLERYELGEWCPHDPFARHARRRDTVEAQPVEWKPGRWWRAIGPDGEVWSETSDEDEVREDARPGDRIERLWTFTRHQWRPA